MTIQLIVPCVAGGGSDQRARLAARYMAKHLGEPIDVVNRTGAVAGHEAIAAAPADGSVIGLITGEIGMMHWHEGLTKLAPADYTPLAVPFVESAALIGLLLLASAAALAHDHPARPARIIVPLPAGSSTAIVMRATAQELAPRLRLTGLYREPQMAEYLESQSVEVAVGAPGPFAAFARSERERSAQAVKDFHMPRQ